MPGLLPERTKSETRLFHGLGLRIVIFCTLQPFLLFLVGPYSAYGRLFSSEHNSLETEGNWESLTTWLKWPIHRIINKKLIKIRSLTPFWWLTSKKFQKCIHYMFFTDDCFPSANNRRKATTELGRFIAINVRTNGRYSWNGRRNLRIGGQFLETIF